MYPTLHIYMLCHEGIENHFSTMTASHENILQPTKTCLKAEKQGLCPAAAEAGLQV